MKQGENKTEKKIRNKRKNIVKAVVINIDHQDTYAALGQVCLTQVWKRASRERNGERNCIRIREKEKDRNTENGRLRQLLDQLGSFRSRVSSSGVGKGPHGKEIERETV